MDKTLAGLIGAAGLLATSAQAATAPPRDIGDVMQAQSYADLLTPIPNATTLLKASDAAQARIAEPGSDGQLRVTPVQWWYWEHRRYHHHHHHHHHYYYHHHHHHHHHHHT